MKKLLLLFTAILVTVTAFAQAPEKMSYQAVVRDGNNNLVVSASVGMQISILQGSPTGTSVYVESHTPTTNVNGVVSIEIGGGTVVSGTFAGIDWGNGPYYLKTETDPTGGTTYTITGTSQLLSVPYALHANTADSIVGGVAGGSTDKFYLGQDTLGGIVYYIYKDGTGTQHGLIVNTTESTAVWQATAIATNADRTEDGTYNTAQMIASANPCAAAIYATGLGAGWYLPSIDELGLLYNNRFSANKGLRTGGFTLLSTAYHWSSTERDTTDAYNFNFYNGGVYGIAKGSAYSVRAVRAF